jgi:bacterioferritin-associated ferredoxin
LIVCSCNVLSDQDVRSAVEAERTRSTSQVYGCLGCSAQCGRCARTIRRLMDEALGSAHAAFDDDRRLVREAASAPGAQAHLAATVNRVIRRLGINSAHLAT